jgi:hypothetical protein
MEGELSAHARRCVVGLRGSLDEAATDLSALPGTKTHQERS